jgi:hypothetical protein
MRLLTLVISLALVSLAGPPAAAAVQPLGDPQLLAAPGCLRSAISAGPDGVLRGFVQCDSGLRYVVRTSGAWQVQKLLSHSGYPYDSTQDTTGTYLLYATDVGFAVLKVARDGSVGPRRYVGEASDLGGSLVARDGRWWTVFASRGDRTGGRSALFEAGTLFGSNVVNRQITAGSAIDAAPTISLRSGGGLQLAWSRVTYDTDGVASSEIRLAATTGGTWQSRSLAREPGGVPVHMAVAGPYTFLTWLRQGRPLIATNESGAFRTRTLQVPACAVGGRVAASGSTVFVAWKGCNGRTGDAARQEVYLAERRAGAWATTTAFSGATYELTDVTAVAGKATVGASDFSGDPDRYRSFSRTQR